MREIARSSPDPVKLLAIAAIAATSACCASQANEFREPRQAAVFVAGSAGYHTYRIPAIVLATNNDLVAICEGRRNGRGDAGDIDMLCKRSRDNGQTWGPVQVIWDDGQNTCGNPCPVVDRSTGAIWLFMTHNLGGDQEQHIVRGASDRDADGLGLQERR